MERILCAAIWYKDIKLKKVFVCNVLPVNCDRGLVFCGHRHGQCMYTMISVTGVKSTRPAIGEYVQGFLTSDNRFVDRIEGAKIAVIAKQAPDTITYLFSEDLY